MGDNKTYRDYFAIDEKYYASVTAKLIEEGKVSWKQFYPHETFVDLLEKTHVILPIMSSPKSLISSHFSSRFLSKQELKMMNSRSISCRIAEKGYSEQSLLP